MTVASERSRVSYPGAGSAGPFAIPFRFFVETDLQVIVRDTLGDESELVYGTAFTVLGARGPSGTLTLNAPLDVGNTLVIRRRPPVIQSSSFRNQGSYFGSSHEEALDRVVMQVQAVQDQVDRAVTLPDSYDPSSHDLQVAPETGKVLGWNSESRLTSVTLDSSTVALPGDGRTVPTLSAYLANNAVINVLDYRPLNVDVADILDGVADASGMIQSALNAAKAKGGGLVVIPAGTMKIAHALYLYGASHVTIQGAGRSVTILTCDNTITQPLSFIGGTRANESWGVISIDKDPGGSAVTGIRVADLSIVRTGGGTFIPAPDPLYYGKCIYFADVADISFERVGVSGGNAEALYSDGIASPSKVRIVDCEASGVPHNAFNINTLGTTDVTIERNRISSCAYGIQVVGFRQTIAHNILSAVQKTGIIVGEPTYPQATRIGGATVIVGNVLDRMGSGGDGVTAIVGILVQSGGNKYTDNFQDLGMLAADNDITYAAVAAGQAFTAITIVGSAKVASNYIGGLTGIGTNAVGLSLNAGASPAAGGTHIVLENNTIDKALNGVRFGIGVQVAADNTTSIYCSGNRVLDSSTFAWFGTNTATKPFVSWNGEIMNGPIYDNGLWTVPGVTNVNNDGGLNDIPLSGSSTGALRSTFSRDVLASQNVDADTTPSVKGRAILAMVNSGATTVTNFDDGIYGQTVTLLFFDANTTIQHGANIKLAGGVNFAGTANDALTLVFRAAWFEVSRSVNG